MRYAKWFYDYMSNGFMSYCLITLTLKNTEVSNSWGKCNGFLSLKVNILSIQSSHFSWHAILIEHQ